jgi:hypothetical protein
MHDNPVWSLFHRTAADKADDAETSDEAEEAPEPSPPNAAAAGNERLMELARSVELAGAPPTQGDEPG